MEPFVHIRSCIFYAKRLTMCRCSVKLYVNTLEETLQCPGSSNLQYHSAGLHKRIPGSKNSRTMLLPLLRRFPDKVRFSLFHTPNLRGLLRLLLPERFNETIGLQHMKIYSFDDNVILSGANLSDSYFTNRQDPVSDVSLQLQPDDTVQAVEGMEHPYQGNKTKYCKTASEKVLGVIKEATHGNVNSAVPAFKVDILIQTQNQQIPGCIHCCLVHIEHQFYSEVCRRGQQMRLKLREYCRDLWTFHAKVVIFLVLRLWFSKFGYRSVHRDLEAQIALVTENQALQQQLHQEQEQLYNLSSSVSPTTFQHPTRDVKLWVKLVTPLIKNFF
ncbi:hypothetical protein GDO86_014053 [Hymenochirus boettgeri]|uniref:CDP-diacylglycerol--glycerol-3-phosphate 3-phosphatidyltransferase n=1 Tax=Hymenochirus boettgeri TaxID=247094 RepID=A0A8T2JRJ8_9PIPI|nr:hypothetical protein GDO86_014053 [Hymenochirus boettgeri]